VATPNQSEAIGRAKQAAPLSSAALALTGFSAVIGQIVFLRELLVVFSGNEISLGIMLATWLLWTAVGSTLSGRLRLRGNNTRRAVAALEGMMGGSLLPTIWALRASKSIFQTVPGELVGSAPMVLTSLVCLSLFCLVSGALFVAAARMRESECSVSARVAAGSVYLFEAAGSALGGIVASIVLLRFLDAFQIATILAILNVCMAAIVLFGMGRDQHRVLTAAAAFAAIVLLFYVEPSLDRSAQARLWHGFRVLGSTNSIYGNLTVTETGTIRSIYDNGAILANAPDEQAAEEAVHYALLEHAAPRRILMIGGGVNGGIAQALEHPTVERIDYVELDPALIDLARQFFPALSVSTISDPRVHVHYADGRKYLKTASGKYDAILLNTPDPQTALLNRYYTAEFFRSAREHLAPGGLLALELRSSEETMSPELAEFLRCIHRTLQEVFPTIAMIPGETIHFFAATQSDAVTENPQTLISRLQARKLKTQYVSQYFIPFRMMPDRMAQVHEQLRPSATTPVNRDFAPIAYYFDVVLWRTQFKWGHSGWFRAAARIPFTNVLGAVLFLSLLLAVLLALLPGRESRARCAAVYCLAATGFTGMTLQILLLLAFQSIYGYVYHQLAILIGLCMAGIAFGSWLGTCRKPQGNRSPSRNIAATQLLLVLSGPALILTFSLLAKISGTAATWLAAQLVFPALAALSGVLGGYQFPVAAEIYLPDRDGRSKVGTIYAIDLLGGCVGALLLCSYLIPVFGFWKTAWLGAAINLAPALLAARVSMEAKTIRT
jgi:spermidine synthase